MSGNKCPLVISSSWDMMVAQAACDPPQSISTCSSALDHLMGGGFPLGIVSEVAASAGSGKTQICFQACVNVQLPAAFGGIEGEAVFLDSEKTFAPERIVDMAQCLSEQYGLTSRDRLTNIKFSPDTALSRIYYHQIRNPKEFLQVVSSLDQMITSKPQACVAAPLRHEFEDYNARAEYLVHIGAMLAKVAAKHVVAVVVTNQMVTKIGSDDSSSDAPSLGKAWASVPGMQIVIGRSSADPRSRWAKLTKISNPPISELKISSFLITKDGIRDLV